MEPNFVPMGILAKDFEDLQILAAHLQDALMPVTAMLHDRPTETFTILANRHCWEHQPVDHEGELLYHRVHSGVCFRGVKEVRHRGFHSKGPLRTLNFLTAQSNGSNLHLIFSGDNEIRLQVEAIHCHLGDLGYPWPTHKRPRHLHEHVEVYRGFGLG